jgi:hypothetical protein
MPWIHGRRRASETAASERLTASGREGRAAQRKIVLGQFEDSFYREVSLEVLGQGLHSIRHTMSAQGASDAKIPRGGRRVGGRAAASPRAAARLDTRRVAG